MFQMQTAASPVIVAMLLGCVLGAGFMVRFLIALTVDGRAARAVHVVRPGGLHYAGDRSRTRAPYRAAVADSASHLAIGVARLTSAGKLLSVAGGGDTVAALAAAGVEDKFSYVSTAGGAFLEWMEGKTLPGVAALVRAA